MFYMINSAFWLTGMNASVIWILVRERSSSWNQWCHSLAEVLRRLRTTAVTLSQSLLLTDIWRMLLTAIGGLLHFRPASAKARLRMCAESMAECGRLTGQWTTFWTSALLPYASFRRILFVRLITACAYWHQHPAIPCSVAVHDVLQSHHWHFFKVRHCSRRCELRHQLLHFFRLFLEEFYVQIWCRVVRSRDFSAPEQIPENVTWSQLSGRSWDLTLLTGRWQIVGSSGTAWSQLDGSRRELWGDQ